MRGDAGGSDSGGGDSGEGRMVRGRVIRVMVGGGRWLSLSTIAYTSHPEWLSAPQQPAHTCPEFFLSNAI